MRTRIWPKKKETILVFWTNLPPLSCGASSSRSAVEQNNPQLHIELLQKAHCSLCALPDQSHDPQMVAGVAGVVFGRRVAAVGRGAGWCQGLCGGRGGQGPGSECHVESVHATAVDARLNLVRAQVGRFSLHLDHPAHTNQVVNNTHNHRIQSLNRVTKLKWSLLLDK